jgi:hypothetical protein
MIDEITSSELATVISAEAAHFSSKIQDAGMRSRSHDRTNSRYSCNSRWRQRIDE